MTREVSCPYNRMVIINAGWIIMKKRIFIPSRPVLVLQAFFVYSWLTVLSPLSSTDTYYSVYLLCGLGGLLCMYDNYKREAFCTGKQKAVLLICAACFSTAVTLANYELFEPLSVLQNLFDAVCTFLGGSFIGYNVLLCLLTRLPLPRTSGLRKHPGRVFVFVFSSIAVIDLLYLFLALYPGVLTTDSYTTVAQLMGDQPYDNVMPFWHTVTVKVFMELGLKLFGDMNGAVATFHTAQILFMAACFGYVLVTLYQMRVPAWLMGAVYVLYAFMPYNIVYSVTLWKDIPFAGAAVLFVTGFYRLLKDIGKCRWLNYAAFTLGALGFSLWRTNGWYAFLVMVLLMLLLLRREHKTLLFIMVAVLLLCWVLIHPVLDALDVGGTNFVEAFAVPMQQIARVIHLELPITEAELALLNEVCYVDRVKELYNPQTVDPVKFETFFYHKVDYILENWWDYLSMYIRLGLRYPAEYLKAWVEETKGYWNGGYKFWTYTLKLGENIYGIYQTPGDNIVARLFAAMFRYLEKPAVLQPLTSIGLYVWMLVTCFIVNVLKKRKEFLLAIPILVLAVGLWLGTPVFSEFRYAYPMILAMPMILAATLYPVEGQIEKRPRGI